VFLTHLLIQSFLNVAVFFWINQKISLFKIYGNSLRRIQSGEHYSRIAGETPAVPQEANDAAKQKYKKPVAAKQAVLPTAIGRPDVQFSDKTRAFSGRGHLHALRALFEDLPPRPSKVL
jgi:hypothetical protein